MFIINETEIDNETLVTSATIVLNNGNSINVTVPVKLPKTKEDVIDAVQQREINENKKYDALPTLTVIKEELDTAIIGKECRVNLEGKVAISEFKVG